MLNTSLSIEALAPHCHHKSRPYADPLTRPFCDRRLRLPSSLARTVLPSTIADPSLGLSATLSISRWHRTAHDSRGSIQPAFLRHFDSDSLFPNLHYLVHLRRVLSKPLYLLHTSTQTCCSQTFIPSRALPHDSRLSADPFKAFL